MFSNEFSIHCSQKKTLSKRKKIHGDRLTHFQIQYLRGQVEKHELEMELLQVKLRILKNAEKKFGDARVIDFLGLMSED